MTQEVQIVENQDVATTSEVEEITIANMPPVELSKETIKDGSFLWYAVETGNIENVALALNAGSNPTYNYAYIEHSEDYSNGDEDLGTETPLAIEINEENHEISILRKKETLEYSSNHLLNALVAHPKGDKATRILDLLIKHGADVNSELEGETALDVAIQRQQHDAIKLLLEHGADINRTDRIGNRPLDAAIILEDKKMVDLILGATKDKSALNQLNGYDTTALHIAADLKHYDIMESLIKAGADVNIENRDGSTPLLLIFQKNTTNLPNDIIKLLVDNGADVNAKSQHGNTALDILQNPYAKTIEFLKEHGALKSHQIKEQQRVQQFLLQRLQQQAAEQDNQKPDFLNNILANKPEETTSKVELLEKQKEEAAQQTAAAFSK